jgi:hypothetical protein
MVGSAAARSALTIAGGEQQPMWFKSLVIGALVALAPLAASAQSNAPTNIRGKIQKVDGKTLTIKSRDGATVPVSMADNFVVLGVVKAKLSDIKENDFVGVAAVPHKDGTLHAQEVLIFPDAARGTGEGHYPWDLRGKGDTMTNATVTGFAAAKAKGRVLKLKYKDGDKEIVVDRKTPVVTFAPADAKLLKPGAAIFVRAPKQPDGTVVAQRAIVEQKGVKPPM